MPSPAPTGTEFPLTLSVGAQTERGKREENQDNMTGFTSPFGSVYIVADGMGGHRGGAEASRTVVEMYRKHLAEYRSGSSLADALRAATTAANTEIYARGHSGDPAVAGMGSTVVLAVISNTSEGMEFSVGHIGDSRAYLLREGVLRQLTRDHSAVQRLIDAQMVAPEQASSHPDASVLTRALGQQQEVELELLNPEPVRQGDVVLLCSDGLSGYVSGDQIHHALAAPRSAPETANALISLALENGSDDNITVQVLRTGEAQDPGRAVRQDDSITSAAGPPSLEHESYWSAVRKAVVSHTAVGLFGFALGLGVGSFWHRAKQEGSPQRQERAAPGEITNGEAGQHPAAGSAAGEHHGQHLSQHTGQHPSQEGTATSGGTRPSPAVRHDANGQTQQSQDASDSSGASDPSQ